MRGLDFLQNEDAAVHIQLPHAALDFHTSFNTHVSDTISFKHVPLQNIKILQNGSSAWI